MLLGVVDCVSWGSWFCVGWLLDVVLATGLLVVLVVTPVAPVFPLLEDVEGDAGLMAVGIWEGEGAI